MNNYVALLAIVAHNDVVANQIDGQRYNLCAGLTFAAKHMELKPRCGVE